MSEHDLETAHMADLRMRAALRLPGAAATLGATARAADALAVLHALASSPATAPDALALLHELQVHQVELDLQAQELQESHAELETALRRQVDLYAALPAGCFTIDAGSRVHELNRAGAEMLGLACDDALGVALDVYVGPAGADRLHSAIAHADAGGRSAAFSLTLRAAQGPARPMVATVGAAPGGTGYLVCMTDALA